MLKTIFKNSSISTLELNDKNDTKIERRSTCHCNDSKDFREVLRSSTRNDKQKIHSTQFKFDNLNASRC